MNFIPNVVIVIAVCSVRACDSGLTVAFGTTIEAVGRVNYFAENLIWIEVPSITVLYECFARNHLC